MPRIPYPDLDALPPKLKDFMSRVDNNVNVFRMLPWAETATEHWHRLGNALLQKSALDPVLREMASVRVGHLARAGYEVYQHERPSAQIGRAESGESVWPAGVITVVEGDVEK